MTAGQARQLSESRPRPNPLLLTSASQLVSTRYQVDIPRHLFADILRLIAEMRPPPDAAPA